MFLPIYGLPQLLKKEGEGKKTLRQDAKKDAEVVMLTIPDLTSRIESSQQGIKPESSRVEESTPE